LTLKFHAQASINPSRLMELVSGTHGAQFTPAGVLILPLDGLSAPGEILARLKQHLEQLQA
jgi:hypothetical protein